MRNLHTALIALLFIFLFAAPAAAAPDDPGRRPVVAFLPVVNNASQKNTGYLIEMINDSLYAKFGNERNLVISGQTLQDAFRRQGIEDPRLLDPETLNFVLRAMRVDYAVRTEIMPIYTRQRIDFPDVFLFMKTWIANVPFSCTITNVHNGAVVYEFSYSDNGKHEGFVGFANRDYAIRIAMAKVLDRFEHDPIILD